MPDVKSDVDASMVNVTFPTIDARDLAREMRQTTESPQGNALDASSQTAAVPTKSTPLHPRPGEPGSVGVVLQPFFTVNKRDEYHVGQLLQFHDAEFITVAYRAILKREPDLAGSQFYLEGLRSGRLDRLTVILNLRNSGEGRRHNVRIVGLTLPQVMRRVTALPLIGYPIQMLLDMLRLPVLMRRFEDSIAFLDRRNQQLANSLSAANRHASELSAALNELGENLSARADELRRETVSMESRIQRSAEARALETKRVQNTISAGLVELARKSQADLRDLIEQLRIVGSELRLHRTEIAALQDRATSTREPNARTVSAASQSLFDARYLELENRFRGGRQAVKDSFRVYLPLIQSAPNDDLPVVDLGCGRGEWLELLTEAHCHAIGVDTNRVVLDLCGEQSLHVVESDGLTYLREAPANSLRAVTAFHFVEHLPINTLMLLLDEIWRTLQIGGIAILETPNPDNMFVSSNYFYCDPSHRHPLPSKLMSFLLESAGFSRIEIMPLHPCEEGRFQETDEVSQRLNELFYGPMDYAIVGWKRDQ